MSFKDPKKNRQHMARMRQAREARNRGLDAADAIAADNEDISVDDIAPPAPVRVMPAKKVQARAPARKVPPKRKSPVRRTRYEDEAPIARTLKTASATPKRTPTAVNRTVSRDSNTGRLVVTRNGKTYTRRIVHTGDKFHMDAADIPDGMSYQWIAVTVMGAQQRNSIAAFIQNGWEAVPMSRYPGRYGPEKDDGPIILDGLMLCERPIELTREARDEEVAAARNLIRTRNDQFVPKMPESRARRGTELRARRSIEGMPQDIGRPSYQIDVDEGLVPA